jgi:hypothetical protein
MYLTAIIDMPFGNHTLTSSNFFLFCYKFPQRFICILKSKASMYEWVEEELGKPERNT